MLLQRFDTEQVNRRRGRLSVTHLVHRSSVLYLTAQQAARKRKE
jgi:hypothetical protein